jgi:anaphase-promoting complex subunit 2
VELFSKEFGKLKGSRKLEWIEQLGFVDLELEFDGETIEYQCSPAQASIIMEFQDNSTS